MSRRSLGLALSAALLTGCGWSNSMYWARRYSNDAIETERRGRPFEAQILWGQAINKADSAWARSHNTKFEARLYKGIANARLGNCVASLPDLEGALAQTPPGLWFERGEYELGRCTQKLKLPGAEAHLVGLLANPDRNVRVSTAVVLADVYLDARRWSDILRLLPIEEHPALRFARAVAHAATSELALAREEVAPLVAAKDTSVAWQRLVEVLSASRSSWTDTLLDQLTTFPKLSDIPLEMWYLAAVRGAVVAGDTVAAKNRLELLRNMPPTNLVDAGQLALAEFRVSHVVSIADLAGVIASFPAPGAEDAGPNSRLLRLRRTAEQLLSETDSLTGVPQGDLRLFAASEDATEVLQAPLLTRTLLQRLERDWPQSPYLVKAIMARILNEPDSAEALRSRFSRFPNSAYVTAMQGVDAQYTVLEDSLAGFIRLRANAIFARGNIVNHGPFPE